MTTALAENTTARTQDAGPAAAGEPHRHGWVTRSRHSTSEGVVHYQQCACGAWSVRRSGAAIATVAP